MISHFTAVNPVHVFIVEIKCLAKKKDPHATSRKHSLDPHQVQSRSLFCGKTPTYPKSQGVQFGSQSQGSCGSIRSTMSCQVEPGQTGKSPFFFARCIIFFNQGQKDHFLILNNRRVSCSIDKPFTWFCRFSFERLLTGSAAERGSNKK